MPSETIQIATAIPGQGTALFAAAKSMGLEGIVAKRRSSTYELGRRSQNWLKVKTTHEADLVVGGWSPGQGWRDQTVGALLMGAYEEGPEGMPQLRFVGSVGSGFTDRTLAATDALLRSQETDESPFSPESQAELRRSAPQSHWVHPTLVAQVEFREVTSATKLRAPVFKGLRQDKPPADCTVAALRASGDAC
ncbi:MAG: hypothetical protein NVSMB32_17150 [Actinomycetota bacterium]